MINCTSKSNLREKGFIPVHSSRYAQSVITAGGQGNGSLKRLVMGRSKGCTVPLLYLYTPENGPTCNWDAFYRITEVIQDTPTQALTLVSGIELCLAGFLSKCLYPLHYPSGPLHLVYFGYCFISVNTFSDTVATHFLIIIYLTHKDHSKLWMLNSMSGQAQRLHWTMWTCVTIQESTGWWKWWVRSVPWRLLGRVWQIPGKTQSVVKILLKLWCTVSKWTLRTFVLQKDSQVDFLTSRPFVSSVASQLKSDRREFILSQCALDSY